VGTEAVPLVPFATPEAVAKLCSTLAQPASAQTWKLIVPESLGSGSAKVAVNAGVAEATRNPAAGSTNTGAVGKASLVEFVTEIPPALAAALPVGCAESRTIGLLPGFVYASVRTSRWWTALARENVVVVLPAP